MLCSYCEGTENQPGSSALLVCGMVPLPASIPAADQPDNCLDCGEELWAPCQDCIGLGRKLRVAGQCGRCGRSIPYWEACTNCRGEGKVLRASHNCVQARRKVRPAHINPHSPNASQRTGRFL